MRKDGDLDTTWSVDRDISVRIRESFASQRVISRAVLKQSASILDIRETAILAHPDRDYNSRREIMLSLGLLEGVGYPIVRGYRNLGDEQLLDYFSRVSERICQTDGSRRAS